MTPTPTRDSAVSPVRDERLKQIVAYVELMGPNSEPCVPGDVAQSMATELLSRRSLDTADGVELPATNMFARGAREDIAVMPEGEVAIEFRTGGEIERARLASRTPNTETVVKALEWDDNVTYATADSITGRYRVLHDADEPNEWTVRDRWGNEIAREASMEAAQEAAQAIHNGFVLSALASPPSPAEVTEEQAEAMARAHYDARMDRKGAYDDAPAGTKAVEKVFAKIALTAALQLNKKG